MSYSRVGSNIDNPLHREIDSVDDFGEDLGTETMRLSSATVGFVVGFGAETIHGWFL